MKPKKLTPAEIKSLQIETHDSIKLAIRDMLRVRRNNTDMRVVTNSFYAFILSKTTFSWTTNPNICPTMGVYLDIRGINIIYNLDYVKRQSFGALKFTLMHEVDHVLCRHHDRTMYRDPEISNNVQDMIINKRLIEFMNTPDCVVGMEKPDIDLYILPSDYDGINEMYETVYDYYYKDLKQQQDAREQMMEVLGDKFQEWFDNLTPEERTQYGKQDLDIHYEDDISPEAAKTVVDNLINDARNRGQMPSDVEKFLNVFNPTNNTDEIYKYIGRFTEACKLNNPRRTFRRLHRRGFEGLKGKLKVGTVVNVLLDTSGSMSGEVERILEAIFNRNVWINLIQVDTEVHSFDVLTCLSDYRNLKLTGFGGTILQPGIDYFTSNKELKKNNLMILTDGYTDNLDLSKVKKCLIVTVDRECPIASSNEVKQIRIERIGQTSL